MLYDYLAIVIDNWNGDVVIMGDFNKVRKQVERYGSIFNVQGVNAFNSFISIAGLEEVPLVEELKSVNESFNLSIEELYKVRAIAKAIMRERDATIFAHCEKIILLEEQSESFYEEMGDKVKRFNDEKKVFENKILKLENDLTQRVKDFDDVKTELSRRTDKFETYFANLEKENALLNSQLASQNYTSLQKKNNDLRTSYNVLKEEYEISCAKLEKENNDLKMYMLAKLGIGRSGDIEGRGVGELYTYDEMFSKKLSHVVAYLENEFS
nr:RNA-directed DNA polymerase, eukaryota [Tanacetum cinerariifolium]